ncbi:nucleoside triphosphate pyrophosphohydrolase [Psychrosphaera saromensis]|uniref:Nucleoside triphosphate pyrophosphohydrolase n=1 Tax=Psychrosphaera saromensis TaxID=716813 RepID=A0A2S7UYK9_9GAMM|nr:nucleoside triphosphate pyrophosphohydrolase [Psychrosphaera saromensis]PQJ55077.1 nucleoside triphosphate pyrophosphohydrolase [Psychrosphaera saromensis]GHB78547.1 nucleoside triphosphate pyrophosphohydrolase [Psychrosphaera saromensis]GLQ13623.1 nucleoside triphosphate pyrophosphohydrolase [Psychrosphaera saromensis]
MSANATNNDTNLNKLSALSGLEKLTTLMSMLRHPETGCPWDLKQTFDSLIPYTIEEAYEVAQAIEDKDYVDLKSELGDLLFQVVFYAQLGQEQSLFDFNDVINTVCDKLISRHPHVFSDVQFDSEQQIKQNWEKQKSKERQLKDSASTSVLDDIPLAIPAISRAYKIQKRAASVGFDWPDVHGAFDKVSEEIEEVKAELRLDETENKDNIDAIADELGDLYFALTNVTRHLGLNPEQVIKAANNKFEKRFRQVEHIATANNADISQTSLEQLDTWWEQAKLDTKNTK